jgi:hypothetical protein
MQNVLSLEMMLFGGVRPFSDERCHVLTDPPEPRADEEISGYVEMDPETGVITISEDGHTKTLYPNKTEYKD